MTLNIFDYLFLPVLFFILAVTAFEDVKYGKIRNKWIVFGLFWAIGVYLFFILWFFAGKYIVDFYYFKIIKVGVEDPRPFFYVYPSYILESLGNFLFSIVVAITLWFFRGWAAGDAKLFIVCCLLIPLKYYFNSYLSIFPSFVLLVNIFVPVFFFLIIKSFAYLLKYIFEQRKEISIGKIKASIISAKDKIRKKIIGFCQLFLGFWFLMLIVQYVMRYIPSDFHSSNFVVFLYLAMLIAFSLSVKLFRNKKVFLIIGLFILCWAGIYFFYDTNFLIKIVVFVTKMVIFFLVFLELISTMMDFYINKMEVKEILVSNLLPNTRLSEKAVAKIGKEIKNHKEYDGSIGRMYSDGLTSEQIKTLQSVYKGEEKIEVYKPFSFSVWIALAVVLTLIFKISLLQTIMVHAIMK